MKKAPEEKEKQIDPNVAFLASMLVFGVGGGVSGFSSARLFHGDDFSNKLSSLWCGRG